MVQEISLREIIERKVNYIRNSTSYKDVELENVKEGELRAYKEIIIDIEALSEAKFVDKYLKIIEQLKCQFDDVDYGKQVEQIEQLSGYNNAIVFVLSLLNPKYEFEDCDI